MKVIFMGTPDFAVSTVEAIKAAGHEIVLVVSQPDQPKGRSKTPTPPPVKEWALLNNIPTFQPERIRNAEAIEELKKYEADIFVVAAFGQILPKEVLEMPRLGCVNVHASLLPKYRGAAPIQWAVINGDAISGVTTMQMGVGLDDGNMLLKEEVTLAPDETGGSLFDRLAIVGGELCVRTIEALDRGEITPIPQNEDEATHVGMIKKSLGEMDFSKPAVELERLIRGLNPWPSAYTRLDGKMLKIWKASVVEGDGGAGVDAAAVVGIGASAGTDAGINNVAPGTVVFVDSSKLIVACGDGALSLEEIQLEGKKRMNIGDFLRGRAVEVGTILG